MDVRDVPDVVLALAGSKLPLTLALLGEALNRDKEAGHINAPRLLQRAKAPKFEGGFLLLLMFVLILFYCWFWHQLCDTIAFKCYYF